MTGATNWQTLLFVPVGADRHLASAVRHRPDAIILDLEDAIAPADKPLARTRLAQAQALIADAGLDCVVRVNAGAQDMAQDLLALDKNKVSALLLPKVESAAEIANLSELGEGLPLIALVETPKGVLDLAAIAAAPGLCGLMLGSEDLSAAMAINPDSGGLMMPAANLAMAALAYDLLPIGFPGSIANFRDLDLYGRQITTARSLGFQAVAAIHPLQLAVIRTALAPDPSEIEWARKVIAKASEGAGVSALDKIMIDAPVIARARRILSRGGQDVAEA